MAQKKKPVVASKTTKPKRKQPLAVGIEPRQYQEDPKLINEKLVRLQVELEAAFRQYTDLYDFAPVGYFTLGRDGTIRQVNLAGANLLGVEHCRLINQRLGLFVTEESRPVLSAFLEELLSGEDKKKCEVLLEKKDNELLWVRLESTCFEGGHESRAAIMDITERKQMVQALQESETRYRELIELAVDGILISSHEEIIIGANSRMLNLTGRTLDKLVGKHIGVLFNPSELKSSPFRFDLLQKGETVRNERNLIRLDGSFVPVEMHTKMMPDGTYQSIYHDITDRKQAEEILKESEWRTRIVSELTTDYIFVVDVDPGGILKFRWASDNLFRITGRTVEEVATSDKWGSIIHPDDRVRFFDFVKQILSTASAGEFECRTFYKHGGERWIRIFARPQVGEGNKVRTIVGAIQDITERKRAEKALRESQELFSLFMHHSPIHAYIKEVTPTESRVVQASDNYEQMIGVRGRDMMDKTMEELFPAEFAAKITADDWSVVASGEVLKLDEDLNGRHYTTIKFPLVQGDKTLLAGYTIDITERKLAEVELQYMKEGLETANAELHIALARQQQLAHTDSLTGINNRRYLYELAEYEFGIAIRYQQPFSVIMFDLDHFKEVNDTFGHAAGDQILQLVAKTACAELRSADVIGRYGGEEFVIVLPMTNAQQAHPLAERIRMGVAAIRVPTEIGDAAVTLSIGIVEMSHGRQTESVEDLIRRADKVMYAAKQAGRNRTEIGD